MAKSRRKKRLNKDERRRSDEAAEPNEPRSVSAAPEALGPAPQWALGLASAAVFCMAALPGGALEFLPPVLGWPLAGGAILAWWYRADAARAADPAARARQARLAEGSAVALVLGVYFLLKVVGLRDSNSDDNIYFYLAQRVAQGAMPYRDFFFSHPPVHLLVPAFLFRLFGFSAPLAKLIPVIAEGGAGLCLYLALRPVSRAVAVLAVLLHLTAYEVLMGATHMNGENLMTLFLMGALLAMTRRRFLLGGALGGLALGTGLYVLPGLLALGFGAGRDGRRPLARFVAGFAATFGALFGLFWALAGHAFIDGVVLYHLKKPLKGGTRLPVLGAGDPFSMLGALVHNLGEFLDGKEFQQSLFYHSALYAAAAMGIAFVAGAALRRLAEDRGPLAPSGRFGSSEGQLVVVATLAIALFFLQFAALSEIYSFYMVPMLALAAIPAAHGLVRAHDAIRRSATAPHGLAAAACVVGFGLHAPLASSLHDSLWPDEVSNAGKVVKYEWRDPIAFGWLAGLSRDLFFADHRIKGDISPAYRHYVWNKLLTFSTAHEIGDYVREHSAPDETLTGASTLAPLVALYAGRRVAADEADTNSKRFSSGETTEAEFWKRICADRVRFILSAPQSWFEEHILSERETVKQYFVRDREFSDGQLHHFSAVPLVLYRRTDAGGLPPGIVCKAP